MPVTGRFLIVKNKDSKEIKYFDYDKLEGYDLKPKSDTKFMDAINVSRVIIINPSFSEKIATRKMNAKFARILELMNYVSMNSDDDDGTNLDIVLNETTKFQRELINKYHKFVNEQQLELMLKKVEIIQKEIKLRKAAMLYKDDLIDYQKEPEEELEGKKRR